MTRIWKRGGIILAALTRLLGVLAIGVGWLRTAWDARHERIGFAHGTD